MTSIRLKRTKFVVGLMAALLGAAIIYLIASMDINFARTGNVDVAIGGETPAAAITTETEEPIVTQPTETPAEVSTEVATTEATEAPQPTAVPTEEPTEIPTEAPIVETTQEPAAQAVWQVVEAGTNQPVNQALVLIAFNKNEPALVFGSDENGNVEITFDQVPNLGENDLGYVVFRDPGSSLEKTELWFRMDSSGRSLVLVDDDGEELDGPVELFTYDQATEQDPGSWEESQVWSGCEDEECATEIALTSGYFQPGQVLSCQEAVLDSPSGTEQRYRAANGLSVVESTREHPNVVGPRWPGGGDTLGWACGNEQERIFVVSGCGNIALPRD